MRHALEGGEEGKRVRYRNIRIFSRRDRKPGAFCSGAGRSTVSLADLFGEDARITAVPW